MLNLATQILAYAPTYLALSSDSDGSFFPYLFLLSGPVFFFVIYTKYRNKDKRHHHERETKSQMANLRAADQKVNRVVGVSNSRIRGDNADRVTGARN